MPKYKSIADYKQVKSRLLAAQEASSKITEAKANVERLRGLHAKYCELFGDSGSVRQQLENAENYLEQLKEALKQQAI
jgi:flagellar biosynthesis chaperone FliJ